MELEPSLLRSDPAPAALAGREQRRHLVDPSAAAVAIDAGGGEIPHPPKPAGSRDVRSVQIEHGIAGVVRRDRAQNMGRTREQRADIGERMRAVEAASRYSRKPK